MQAIGRQLKQAPDGAPFHYKRTDRRGPRCTAWGSSLRVLLGDTDKRSVPAMVTVP